MADIVRISYVSIDGKGTPENGGGNYVSLETWFAAQQGDLIDQNIDNKVFVYNDDYGNGVDGGQIENLEISGANSDENHRYIVEGLEDVIDANGQLTGYILLGQALNTVTFRCNEAALISKIRVGSNRPSSGQGVGFQCQFLGSGVDYVKLDKVVIQDILNNSAIGGGSMTVTNALLINCRDGCFPGNNTEAHYFNVTAIGRKDTSTGVGMRTPTNSTGLRYVNCTAYGYAEEFGGGTGTPDGQTSNNASSDASAIGPNPQHNITTAAFVNYDTEDYRPAPGGAFDNTGANLSAVFTDDIIGNTRTQWDISCYAIVAGGPTPPIVDAGGPYSGTVGTPIALDSASVSPGSDPSPTLLWSIVSGGTGTFSDDSIVNPTFTPDSEGQYVLRLSADPDDGDPVTDDTTLDSQAAPLDVTFDGPNIITQSGEEDSVFTFNENGQGNVASRFTNATFYELSPLSSPLPASLTVNPTTGNIEGTLDAATAGDYPGILIRGSINETMTVGNNAGFIYGYRNDAGDVFGALTGDIVEGVQIIRAQVNTSGNVIFVRFFGSVQLPGVNLLRWASDDGNFVDLPWDGGNGDYRGVDADFTAFISANDGLAVGCRIYKAD